jgi:hypothetical protein
MMESLGLSLESSNFEAGCKNRSRQAKLSTTPDAAPALRKIVCRSANFQHNRPIDNNIQAPINSHRYGKIDKPNASTGRQFKLGGNRLKRFKNG